MNQLSIRLPLAVVFALALGVGAAQAQDDPPPHADHEGVGETDVEAEIEEVPDAQKGARSTQALSRMKAILNAVLGHLTEAREEKDVVKLNCVNEKLTAVKGLLKISEQADVTLREAVARGDTEVGSHEFEKITIALRKCEQLLAESEACVGELAVYAGDTEVEMELVDVPEEEPEDQLAAVEEQIEVIIADPVIPMASPFL